MTDRELMQQALDALKVMRPACFAETTLKAADTAINALRDRLAQPEQELMIDCPRCGHCCPQPNQEPAKDRLDFWALFDETQRLRAELKFNTTPPTVQLEQGPVAWMHNCIEDNVIAHRPSDLKRHPERWTALYPAPQPCPTCQSLARTVMMDQTGYDPRPWVGLTDEEIKSLPSWWPSYEDAPALVQLVKDVEAKLREKNGG